MRIFPRKKQQKIVIKGLVGIVEPSLIALENGVEDSFNKVIKIHNGVRFENNQFFWGVLVEERPFSEEEVYSLEKIKEIPIVERKFRTPTFFEEEGFEGITT